MTGPNKGRAKIETAGWQALAWDFYDDIGELRFATNWLANALSRVNLIAAIPPATQGDEPTPIDRDHCTPDQLRAVELVEQIGGGPVGQGQIMAGIARQLTVPGVGYIYVEADDKDAYTGWCVVSNEEVRDQNGVLQITDAESGEWVDIDPSDLLIKIWRSHPRKRHLPDSPVRAVLGPLAEIKLLSQRIAADARSRLAGNGLLVIPEEAEFPPGQGNAETGEDGDEFIETLIQVTQIPISDQSSPAATTPLVIRVPGEFVDKIQHITFYSDFDASLDGLRSSAVKRFALGMDMPPEVVLGLSDTNHWNVWKIADEAITLQIEPLAETGVQGLTLGYLQPALTAEQIDPQTAIVWYDTTDLATRPDMTAAATEAHARLQISNEAYLNYIGADASDAPDDDEFVRRLLIGLATANPQLAPMFLLAAGFDIDFGPAPAAEPAPTPTTPAPAPPAPAPADDAPPAPPADDTAPADDAALAAALVAAADGIVERAMERAGSRLRSAAGKGRGGSAAVPCVDVTTLHCTIPATNYANLDHLLAGAWDRVPVIASRFGVDGPSLIACLDGYARGLIAGQHPHDYGRLMIALGADAPEGYVDDRRRVAAH